MLVTAILLAVVALVALVAVVALDTVPTTLDALILLRFPPSPCSCPAVTLPLTLRLDNVPRLVMLVWLDPSTIEEYVAAFALLTTPLTFAPDIFVSPAPFP